MGLKGIAMSEDFGVIITNLIHLKNQMSQQNLIKTDKALFFSF